MRLNELSLPRETEELDELLHSRGWEKLGEGNYASVYSKPGITYALKVFERDSAYLAFLKLIASHPNPHFPKIIGRLRVTEKYRAVRMEKLRPQQSVAVDGYHVKVSALLSAYLIAKRHRLNDIQERNLELATSYLTDKPTLVAALDLISDELLGKFHLDLNEANIMMRADGTPVITDPIYY
jgi:hypothetical protein